jgi:hypothetical protein
MNHRHNTHKGGLIDTIVLIIVALIILGFFNIDLKEIFAEPLVKNNLQYAFYLIIDGIKYVWQTLFGFIQSALNNQNV